MNGDEAGRSLARDIFAAHRMAGSFRRDHEHVHKRRGRDLLEMNVEAVRKRERFALGQVGENALFINFRLFLVGRQDHDDIGFFGRFRGGHHFEPRFFRDRPGFASFIEADHDVHAAVFKVERVRVALAAVTDDGDRFAFEQLDVTIGLIVYF